MTRKPKRRSGPATPAEGHSNREPGGECSATSASDTETAPATGTRSISVRIEGDTLRQIAEVLPAVGMWARSCGMPCTNPADVVCLAVAIFHEQVMVKTEAMLDDAAERPDPIQGYH